MKIAIGIVDDHQLFLKSLVLLVEEFRDYEVVIEASNGKDLQKKMLSLKAQLDMVLIDVDMPVMNGVETAGWLAKNHPNIKTIALSMKDDDKSVIQMIKAGCCAYLLKDIHPDEFEKALGEIFTKGYYNGDLSKINYRRLLVADEQETTISAKEKQFLQLACTDLTYKEISTKMRITLRTVEYYRDSLCKRFNVTSRVGLCMEAVRQQFVTL